MAENSTNTTNIVSPAPQARPAKTIARRILWVCKLGLKAVAVVIALAVLVWIFEDIRWSWMLDKQLEEYRAAGLPTKVEDFNKPPVPQDQNAAPLYLEAYQLIDTKLSKEANALIFGDCNIDNDKPLKVKDHMDVMAQVIASHEKSLALIKQARMRPHCDLGGTFRSISEPVSKKDDMVVFYLQHISRLARILRAIAKYHHWQGNDAAAITEVNDILKMAPAGLRPTSFGLLISVSINMRACDTIEVIAPSLEIQVPNADATKHPAHRQDVEKIIAQLLNDNELCKTWVTAMHFERVAMHDYTNAYLEGRFSRVLCMLRPPGAPRPEPLWHERVEAGVLKPLFKRELYLTAKDMAGLYETALLQRYRITPPTKASILPWPLTLFCERIDFMNRFTTLMFKGLAYRRMAAVVLALRLYEIDHGRRPETLDALVPKHLPAVPRDPFSPTGQPISYIPHGPYPLLYSVGKNQQPNDYKNLKAKPESLSDGDIITFLTNTPEE